MELSRKRSWPISTPRCVGLLRRLSTKQHIYSVNGIWCKISRNTSFSSQSARVPPQKCSTIILWTQFLQRALPGSSNSKTSSSNHQISSTSTNWPIWEACSRSRRSGLQLINQSCSHLAFTPSKELNQSTHKWSTNWLRKAPWKTCLSWYAMWRRKS